MTSSQAAFDYDPDLDELVEQAAERMWGVYPGYHQERFDRSELAPAIRANMTLAVAALRQGRHLTPAEVEPARRLGATRAHQSVPLESIIQAYRQTERVLVLDFLRRSRDWPHDHAHDAAAVLVSAFDELTDAMISSYRDTSSAQESARRHAEDEVVAALTDGVDGDSPRFDRWLQLLGVAEDGHWTAAAVRDTTSDPADLSALPLQRELLLRQLAPLAADVLCGDLNNTLVVLVRTEAQRDRIVETLEAAVARINPSAPPACGIGTVCSSLRTTTRSCRQALAALRVASATDHRAHPVVDYRTVILDTMLLADPLAAETLYESRIAPLHAHRHLVDTLRVLAENHLSQAATARQLFVHLNTVANRLNRVRDLTGADPTHLPTLLEFHLASRWKVLRRSAEPESSTAP